MPVWPPILMTKDYGEEVPERAVKSRKVKHFGEHAGMEGWGGEPNYPRCPS